MRRAAYEWGWMLLGSFAVACLGWWAASRLTDHAAGKFDFDGQSFVAIENGTLICENSRFCQESFEYADDGASLGDRRFAVPGVRYRRVMWENVSWPSWQTDVFALEVSLLIPGSIAALLGALCFWRYRRITRPAPKLPAP